MNWFKRFIARPWLTICMMGLYTMFGKPYFKVFIFQIERGNVAIDAHYNVHFIYELDSVYAQAESDYYDPNLEQQAKVAIYLYDTLGNIAENYMPAQEIVFEEEDIGADVPPLAFRGGEEVRQVVDLADRNGPVSPLDVKMG
ncbi:unnamed protein product [marine sediment metagenome]|uniref:Uncharacterized protein n=1 Tax=marine sediment metagenome TaxID=412755 RepID=X0U4D6_9ZZZZ